MRMADSSPRNDESADGLRTDLQLVRYVLNAAE
jgi:hypothetical protein